MGAKMLESAWKPVNPIHFHFPASHVLLASAFLFDMLLPYYMWGVNDGDYIGCYDSCGLFTFYMWALFALASYRSSILLWTMLLRPTGIHLMSDEELINMIVAVQWWGLLWSIVS